MAYILVMTKTTKPEGGSRICLHARRGSKKVIVEALAKACLQNLTFRDLMERAYQRLIST